ncbi:MAG: hypothetical protein KDC84_06930 [Crocinitomicaceae bacterium]|nr:hypothetical protein [Crocinitomicaceae bacterium]
MKNVLLLLGMTVGLLSFAQNQEKEIDTVIYSNNQKTTKYTDGSQYIELIKKPIYSTEANQKPKFKSKQEELNYLHTYIGHLEKKKEHINSNPEEKKKAEESGWFKQIDGYINESKARIEEIETLLKSKKQ